MKPGEIPKDVFSQTLGTWQLPVAHLAKHLDPVALEWLSCLHTIVAAVLLVKESDKIPLGLNLYGTHALETHFQGAKERWMPNGLITEYHHLFFDHPQLKFSSIQSLNLERLTPDSNLVLPTRMWVCNGHLLGQFPGPLRHTLTWIRLQFVHGWK